VTARAILLLTLLTAACSDSAPASSAPPPAAMDPSTAGSLTGRVVLDGTPPAARVIRLDGDPKCLALAAGEERRSESILVGADNGLANAFVYVKDGLPPGFYPVPTTPVVLDQQKCRYVPRVVGVQVGQPLLIRNSDPLLHNVRSEGIVNQPFDVGTPVQGVELTRTFATREVMVPFKCNVHAWMQAWVGVLEHPYFAVTDADGRFNIPNLPAGTYTVEIWHESLGTQTRPATVTAKAASDLTVTYKAAS
jgi:hypothetical protein